jgi:hypothetical protein
MFRTQCLPYLKRQCHEIVDLWLFHQTLKYALKYFRILLRIRRDMNKYVYSRTMQHCTQGWHEKTIQIKPIKTCFFN